MDMYRHELYDGKGNLIKVTTREWTKEERIRKWKAEMAELDQVMPRYVEDLIDRDGVEGLPEVMIKRYNDKKELRTKKP